MLRHHLISFHLASTVNIKLALETWYTYGLPELGLYIWTMDCCILGFIIGLIAYIFPLLAPCLFC